jgi:hypothetical protein
MKTYSAAQYVFALGVQVSMPPPPCPLVRVGVTLCVLADATSHQSAIGGCYFTPISNWRMLLHTNARLPILNLLSLPAVVVARSPLRSRSSPRCVPLPSRVLTMRAAASPPSRRLSHTASPTPRGRAWPSPLNRSTPPGPRRCGTRACLATRAAARQASAWSGRTSTRPERSATSLDFFEMGMQPWPFPSVAEALHCRATGAWPSQGSSRRIARGSRVARTAGCLTRLRESCVESTSSERCT